MTRSPSLRSAVRSLSLCLVLGLVSILGLTACGTGAVYAAKVDGEVISRKDVDTELAAIAANTEFLKAIEGTYGAEFHGAEDGTYDGRVVALILDRQIQSLLVHRDLVRRKVEVTDADRSAAEEALHTAYTLQSTGEDLFKVLGREYQKRLIEREAENRKFKAVVVPAGTDDAELRSLYEQQKDSLASRCVRHILYASIPGDQVRSGAEATPAQVAAATAKATDARARIVAGADFAAVAKAESADTGSGARGGDLGCVTAEETQGFVPEFAQAIEAAKVGEISQPVTTVFGAHLIQVTKEDVPTFDDVKEQLANQASSASDEKLSAALGDLRNKADVKVDARFGTWTLRGAGTSKQVVSPQAPQVVTSSPDPTTTFPVDAGSVPDDGAVPVP